MIKYYCDICGIEMGCSGASLEIRANQTVFGPTHSYVKKHMCSVCSKEVKKAIKEKVEELAGS